jgi:hypothetical protein
MRTISWRWASLGLMAASVAGLVGCGGGGDGRKGSGSNDDGIGLGTADDDGAGTVGQADGAGDATMGGGDADADGTAGDDADGDDGGEGALPLFDVGSPDGEAQCGGGMGGAVEFSYIWIANTGDSPNTVSKINTQTLVEEGRYMTRSDGGGSPSRTSVALSGHAAVANRLGGVTKIYAHDCPAGPTSTGGPDTELPWGMDACIAWSTDLAYSTQRPMAWAAGTFNETTCQWEDELLWTSGANGGNSMEVLRLDGETGVVLDTVPVPELNAGYYGAYGGAVDGDGNFWFSQLGSEGNNLVRVDGVALTYQIWQHSVAGYGIQVDYKGRPWICGYDGQVGRFTPATQTWDYAQTGAAMYGCMPDMTNLWIGGNQNTIRGVDLESMAVVATFQLAADSTDIHGTSIDFDGNVWGVSRGTMAVRVNPTTGQIDYVGGLNSPYTYSDMTGYGLANSVGPQG